MTEGPFLRVFAFTPSRSGVIDSVLRDELLPDLTRQRDVLDAYAGRHGTGDTGERLVVSIWSSQEAMDAWPGEGQLIAEHSQIADGTETVRHAAGAIAVALMFERDEEARVLRVFEGEVH